VDVFAAGGEIVGAVFGRSQLTGPTLWSARNLVVMPPVSEAAGREPVNHRGIGAAGTCPVESGWRHRGASRREGAGHSVAPAGGEFCQATAGVSLPFRLPIQCHPFPISRAPCRWTCFTSSPGNKCRILASRRAAPDRASRTVKAELGPRRRSRCRSVFLPCREHGRGRRRHSTSRSAPICT